MSVDFPQSQIAVLQDLAARLFERRKPGTDLKPFARELLRTFFDVATFAGLDRVLSELGASDRDDLDANDAYFTALLGQLEAVNIDGGGPRNAKAGQLVACIVGALGLAVVEEPADRNTVLDDKIRVELAAAFTSVIEPGLAGVRDAIIAEARRKLDEAHYVTFTKLSAQLDERGVKILKLPKVPLDAQHACERALLDARNAIIDRLARAAFDKAKPILARIDEALAARLDEPVSLRATPREVAILRASDDRVPLTPAAITHSLLDSLGQLARISWRAPERPVHTYGASKTFAVNDLIEHPKFGRGSVVAVANNRIDVEFPDGKHTLVHAPPKK